ncbi:Type II secretion system (T2SS), protein F [Candidatus Bilamarchaeum dharawalense]|uniref:Type II secretion system (T2SS), protein F n=1 Tax=Candidatus Bilamarchaeum dharawalense TaxID=2885759 RepID=A0A5E4LSV6_9ARCH|nr:Type II secretion system (T2SS), protein F [Candidatus Bilamarchaeum dharawalense]
MKPPKIPFLLLSFRSMERIGRRWQGVGKTIVALQPSLRTTMTKLGYPFSAETYAVGSLASSFLYGLIFFLIMALVLMVKGDSEDPIRIALGASLGMWMVLLLLHLIYPGILIKKVAAMENKDLLFALREIIMDVDSGVPLFDSMKNVATSDYRQVSASFEAVIREVETGNSEVEALKHLAIRSESEFMKRTIWQMVNALESGASMKNALSGIADALEAASYREIKNYSANLNFLLLMYMLVAAVAPSLGVTFMVLLSAFGGLGVDLVSVGFLVGGSAILQVIMIGYMSSTRPELFGG